MQGYRWPTHICVSYLVFPEDGKQITSGSVDKTVKVWDTLMVGRLVQGLLRGCKSVVCFVGFSPDGKRIVSVNGDQDVCV
jgi:WD40 repeat protein